MSPARTLARLTLAALLAASLVPSARGFASPDEDNPPPPPQSSDPPEPKPDPDPPASDGSETDGSETDGSKTDGAKDDAAPKADDGTAKDGAAEAEPKSDPEALEVLKKAVERQGGKDFNGVTALELVFAKAIIEREGANPDGKVTGRFQTDTDGLQIRWQAPDLIATSFKVDGKTTTRGQFRALGKATQWLDDGKQSTTLMGEKYEKDREQVDAQLDLIRALLDVAFLARMESDGSLWAIDRSPGPDGKPRANPRLVRVPKAVAEGETPGLQLAIEFDGATYDPRMFYVRPRRDGDPLLRIGFEYNDALVASKQMQIQGAGETRFPFHVSVWERPSPGAAEKQTFDLYVRRVAFNEAAKLTPESFRPPKR